jgi:bifunctional UDP-N-acetylglucosamine pyrophosphorylase / glucosamine-1-phosphate N-acetyltransferase
MSLDIVILAGGQGKRMRSQKPKVLHEIAGVPMLERVINTASQLSPNAIHVIIGHQGEQIKNTLAELNVNWVVQKEQLGTGHALMQAMPHINDDSHVLVLSGDVPLIQLETLERLIQSCHIGTPQEAELSLLVATLFDPSGLGRIYRDTDGNIQAIIEEKDATDTEKAINEIYSGICIAKAKALNRWLPKLSSENAQGEFYLTEIIRLAVEEHAPIASMTTKNHLEILGVNNRLQLHTLEREYQMQQAKQLMTAGVTLADANRLDVRGELNYGQDVFIDVNSVFIGNVELGEGSYVGPNCLLTDVKLGANCRIKANSVLEGCTIGAHSQVGPFARIRPGTVLDEHCKIGNFVETKKAVFDKGSKASHLSYLGDVTIGKAVNIGAGTITCNYDGANKHQTIIEDGAFIGSDTQLVAPVTVGKNATIGAGSTIRKNAPDDALTLTESRQKTINGWRRPLKQD